MEVEACGVSTPDFSDVPLPKGERGGSVYGGFNRHGEAALRRDGKSLSRFCKERVPELLQIYGHLENPLNLQHNIMQANFTIKRYKSHKVT